MTNSVFIDKVKDALASGTQQDLNNIISSFAVDVAMEAWEASARRVIDLDLRHPSKDQYAAIVKNRE